MKICYHLSPVSGAMLIQWEVAAHVHTITPFTHECVVVCKSFLSVRVRICTSQCQVFPCPADRGSVRDQSVGTDPIVFSASTYSATALIVLFNPYTVEYFAVR